MENTDVSRMYCTSTVIEPSTTLDIYLHDFLPFFCRAERNVFQMLNHGILSKMTKSSFVSMICERYGLLKRTANSIVNDMCGRINAQIQLKKTELEQISEKLVSIDEKIAKKEKVVAEMKPRAAANSLSEEELIEYRAVKKSLYYLKNKKNKLRQKSVQLEKQIKEGRASICFGSKKLFAKQYNLSQNGYRTHNAWYNDFVKRRDSGIFFLGSGDEACGNQILQLHWTGESFRMELIIDRSFRWRSKDIKIVLENVTFPYMQDDICSRIENGQPVSFRIFRKHNRWYLTAMFRKSTLRQTCRNSGVFGVDYNSGFMEAAETDCFGNLISAEHISLEYHGTGSKAESEIKEKLSKFVRHTRDCGKDIVVEDLNFIKKKSRILKGSSKKYSRMIHTFDYSRYLFWMENLCIKYGVGFMKVNPAFTSKIGHAKYAYSRKLTTHRAAALVIARRGQGFRD